MLSEQEILNLYFENVATVSQKVTGETITNHINKKHENLKHLSKQPKEDIVINCIRKHQEQMKHQNKLNSANRWTKQKNRRLDQQKS